ncbi:hypothetical protein DICVIV_10270 [Dictyocaulus viviparus]|uniref:TauD/TfdA-like domain-containing protein n=1 Tax=Dictyocaulus viviparus TaxID=29172 RepID=A0A0D8XMY2_DICVI|nr:hypothetical protein DICVIV_10270 [Dictyocaulus viviparus]
MYIGPTVSLSALSLMIFNSVVCQRIVRERFQWRQRIATLIVGSRITSIKNKNDTVELWKDDVISEYDTNYIVIDSKLSSSSSLKGYIREGKRLTSEEIHILYFCMKTFAYMFIKYGMIIVDNVEATYTTEMFCRAIAPIHDTFLGTCWVFRNETKEKAETSHEDTAYRNEFIGPHTDSTYFKQTPGIQI